MMQEFFCNMHAKEPMGSGYQNCIPIKFHLTLCCCIRISSVRSGLSSGDRDAMNTARTKATLCFDGVSQSIGKAGCAGCVMGK